jgi:hypothetical protein
MHVPGAMNKPPQRSKVIMTPIPGCGAPQGPHILTAPLADRSYSEDHNFSQPSGPTLNETTYFKARAQHFSQLAAETLDPHAKAYYGAMAADMTTKLKRADQNRTVILVGGAAVHPSELSLPSAG